MSSALTGKDMMKRTSIAAAVIVLAALAASPAESACGSRPGTPNNVKVEPTPGRPATLRVTWTNTASERVWWDIDVTDQTGRNFPQKAGAGGPAGQKKGSSHVWSYTVQQANATRCFRIRARTGPFDTGCVSEQWSARVCSTTTGTNAGKWGALAADGKGSWGFAVNQASESVARDAALRGCGNAQCAVKIAGQVACYAYFESRTKGYWYGYHLHTSGATAVQGARSECEKRAPAGTCKLVKSNC